MKVVIMAGGEGKRLRPLTNNMPKPMLPIGRKPILQIIIEQLRENGLKDIIIATGYKDYLIKSYFKDGSHLGVKISYTSEKNRLGTAGPLRLIEKEVDQPILVLNGDILTSFNYKKIIDFHFNNSNEMTVGVSRYEINLPFGVIETFNGCISKIKEKPKFEYLILAGIYVINPEVLKYIPLNISFDIPHLIESLLENKKEVKYYYIEDEWLDIGRIEDYEQANNNWDKWV